MYSSMLWTFNVIGFREILVLVILRNALFTFRLLIYLSEHIGYLFASHILDSMVKDSNSLRKLV